jgi:hypothetical protein
MNHHAPDVGIGLGIELSRLPAVAAPTDVFVVHKELVGVADPIGSRSTQRRPFRWSCAQVLDEIAVGPAQDAVAHVLTPPGQGGHDQARHAVGTAVAGDKVSRQVSGRLCVIHSARVGTQLIERVTESESISPGQGKRRHRSRGETGPRPAFGDGRACTIWADDMGQVLTGEHATRRVRTPIVPYSYEISAFSFGWPPGRMIGVRPVQQDTQGRPWHRRVGKNL